MQVKFVKLMMQRLIYGTLCLCLASPLLLAAEVRDEKVKKEQKELNIGVFPRRSVTTSIKMFTPMVNYLEQQLGHKVSLDVAPDMPAFWSRLQNGDYDLVHLNQYHYVKAHAELGWQVILKNEEFGEDILASAIWVHEDSDIKELKDLQGKLIVFGGGKHAMVASIMNKDLLLKEGLTDDSYIGMSSLYPVQSILSIYYRQADAVGVGVTVTKIPLIRKRIDVSKLRVLAQSKPLAHLPWAVSQDMSRADREALIKSFLSLNESREGKQLLKAAGMSGINPADDRDYDEHRVIIKRVLQEDY